MSEDSEMWAEHKKQRQQKRWQNHDTSLAILKNKGYEVETLNAAISHYRVNGWSFWPTTGKYFNPKIGKSGRGIVNLLRELEYEIHSPLIWPRIVPRASVRSVSNYST